MQQPVAQLRTLDLDPVREHEGALKLARCNAAMNVSPIVVLGLMAPNHELAVLQDNVQIFTGKPGDGQRYAERVLARFFFSML